MGNVNKEKKSKDTKKKKEFAFRLKRKKRALDEGTPFSAKSARKKSPCPKNSSALDDFNMLPGIN